MTVTIDWENLGFSYMKLPYRYLAHFKMDNGIKESLQRMQLCIFQSLPSLHYGQQAFEGLKAYRTKDGSVQLFRPDENAKRLQRTCDRLLMPQVPTDMFVEACKAIVRANEEYVPPYGIGGTYIFALFDWCRRYYRGKTSRRVHFHHLLLCQLEITLKVVWSQPTS